MVLPEDSERKLYKQFHDLCRALNLDKASSFEAWKTYCDIYDPYMLAGDAIHWMGCALYVACKSSGPSAVLRTSVTAQGNLVSLKGLLKLIDLSVVDFFIKIRRWANLANLSRCFFINLDQLERDFTVSMVLFKKFQPIFEDMFTDKFGDARSQKNKKLRINQVPLMRLFDFSWTLFICVKSNYPKVSDDLVNSYHLLLVCFDYIFVNAFMSGRRDIINSNFPTPHNMKVRCSNLTEVSCIIDILCSRHDGISVEAKSIKEYCWRKHIKAMFEKKLLKGNHIILTEIIDISFFELNFKAVNKHYEEYILSVGTFDERIFLGRPPNARTADTYCHRFSEISEELEAKRNMLRRTVPMTPLTGVQYLDPERSAPYSPYNGKIHNFSSLQSIIGMRVAAPSEYLLKIIKSCETEPIIENLIQSLVQRTYEMYKEGDDKLIEHASKLCEIVIKLFYKLMDSIVLEESKKPSFNPKSLLNQAVCITTIYACAFEIMAFLCSSPHCYPWISKVLDLRHYYFYKIIEVVVRSESSLSRELVKHLSSIEENILDSLAWQRDSPLWKAIIDLDLGVPYCEDVCNSEYCAKTSSTAGFNADKLSLLAGRGSSLAYSPGAPLVNKFSTSNQISFNKRLNDGYQNKVNGKLLRVDDSPESSTASGVPSQRPSCSFHQDRNHEKNNRIDASDKPKENRKVKRTGPVALFFRKFYYLSVVRMLDLCRQLHVWDPIVKQKIWTCFEETIVCHTGLMLDRNLDQILMCSIYLISKIVGFPLQFTDVVKCYRNQPQATSNVYREVLISPNLSLNEIKETKNLEFNDEKEVRTDLIKFYNTMFVSQHKSLVKKLNTSIENERLVLSPIPLGLTSTPNPTRKISENHSLFLHSLDLEDTVGKLKNSNNLQLSYEFSRSPMEDLKAINAMVSKVDCVRKRLLTDDSMEKTNSYGSALERRIKGLCNDRMSAELQQFF